MPILKGYNAKVYLYDNNVQVKRKAVLHMKWAWTHVIMVK